MELHRRLLIAILAVWSACRRLALVQAYALTMIGLQPCCGQPTSDATSHWPTIRGQNWDGHSLERDLASSWPAAGPPVLWTRELGQGYSSFVAWQDRIATQYQSLGGQYVVCLSADTGEVLWEYRYAWPYELAGVYPGPRSTPTYDDGMIYFTSPSGLLGCLVAETGNLRWSVQLDELFEVQLPGFGYACSPIVLADNIILPVGGKGSGIAAFDKRTGSVVWHAGNDDASYASAYPITFQGRSLVVGTMQNAVVCHDSTTGDLLWRRVLSSGYDEHSSWPIYQEPYLWIASPFQCGSELLELSLDSELPIKTIRRSELMSNDIFSSVLWEGALFGFDLHEAQAKTHRSSRGIFRCVDFRSGEALWSVGNGRPNRSKTKTADSNARESDDPNIGHTTVIVADGKLILMNDLGELILAEATREKYNELARVSLLAGEMCWTQPCLSRGRLFVRNQSRAACVFLGQPNTLAPRALANSISAKDIPQSEYQDWAGWLLPVEPEYLFDLPSMQWFRSWYAISLLGILAMPLAIVSLAGRVHRSSRTTERSLNFSARESACYWTLTFVLGAVGTTVLSRTFDSFVFTWPICLYVAWQHAIANMVFHYEGLTWIRRLKSASAGLFWLAICLVYFLLCRRLSLLFEWAFLGGFVAALPLNLCGSHMLQGSKWNPVWRVIMGALAFSAFYWSSVLLLLIRYQTGWFHP